MSVAEQVSRGLPSTDLVAAIDRELAADGVLIAAHADARRHRHSRRVGDVVGHREESAAAPSSTERDVAGSWWPAGVDGRPFGEARPSVGVGDGGPLTVTADLDLVRSHPERSGVQQSGVPPATA